MVGDIYLSKIYFTNGSDYKLRPILIIQQNSFDDALYIPLTTNPNNQNAFEFDNDFLNEGAFKKRSYLIIDKTCTIQKNLLMKKIATIKKEILQKILHQYCGFLHENK